MSVIESIPEKAIVAFVTIFITFLQTTTNFYILGPALGGWTSPFALKILGPMNILLISIYVNYYLACTTDPGSTPEGWEPPYAILNPDESIPLKVGSTGPRFCKKCNSYKPPRSHHCKHCGKCVLRMDHHCPWIGNCVGFGNYAHFVRFVFSVIGCCSYGGYLLLWRLQRILDMRKSVWFAPRTSTMELAVVIIDLVMIALVILLVGVLAVYHSYCLFKGQTTIEGWERTKTTRLIRRRKIDPVEFPFDLGLYKNMCSVLGNNPLMWWWPSSSPGNGLSYPVKPNTDPATPYSWPPRDPKDLGATIIERVEKEHVWDGPKLVRRDSEGYLVKEITMEDRMNMLYAQNAEYDREQVEEESIQQQQQEYDPDAYYYDSDSVNSDLSDISDDDDAENEPVVNEATSGFADGDDDEWVDE